MRLGAIPHQVSKDREKEDAQNWHTRTSGREEAITGDREGAAGEREAIESMGPGSLGRNCMDRRLWSPGSDAPKRSSKMRIEKWPLGLAPRRSWNSWLTKSYFRAMSGKKASSEWVQERVGSRKSGRRETGDSRDTSFEEFCCKPGVVDRREVRPRVFFVLFSRWENQNDVCFRQEWTMQWEPKINDVGEKGENCRTGFLEEVTGQDWSQGEGWPLMGLGQVIYRKRWGDGMWVQTWPEGR